MNKEELKEKIEEVLKIMGGKDISFSDNGDSMVTVLFNSEEVISFKAETPGWTYSGIQVDESKTRQYKITFKKEESVQQAENSSSLNSSNVASLKS